MSDIVFLGSPGSGKGTQAQILHDRCGFQPIATGDMLREHRARGTELGRQAEGFMQRGELVPDDLMIKMVEQELPRNGTALFDGFPRTVAQAEALDKLLAQRRRSLQAIFFEIPRADVDRRLRERHREDDTPETIDRRFEVFRAQTLPLVDYYARTGRLSRIDASPAIDVVTDELLAAIPTRAPAP